MSVEDGYVSCRANHHRLLALIRSRAVPSGVVSVAIYGGSNPRKDSQHATVDLDPWAMVAGLGAA